MRIFDVDNDQALSNVVLYLKNEEAKELLDSLTSLIGDGDFSAHSHITDLEFEHELTVVLYDEQKMDSLNERSKKIILTDT